MLKSAGVRAALSTEETTVSLDSWVADLEAVVDAVATPSLVLHARDDAAMPFEHGWLMPDPKEWHDIDGRRSGLLHERGLAATPYGGNVPQGLSRDRVIDAAVELVASKGSEALTMRGLAAVLDVQPTAIYMCTGTSG